MKVDTKIEDKTLIIAVEGRIDTNTVNDLENALPKFEGVEKVIFDFDKLEYISSSGLRLILKTKKQVNDTSIINCSTEVYDIFNMTGFAEMMEVKKALRKISIDNCELIGEGFYGKIYRLDPETIVKVYKISEALDMIKREIDVSKKAFVMGIPTAIAYDIVKVGDSYGAVFELLNAESIADIIKDKNDFDRFINKSVEVLKNMHQIKAKEGVFPRRKDVILKMLKDTEKHLSKKTFDKLNKLIESIPERNTIIHSDFHVKNIMAQNDDLLLIDMESLSVGHPIFEFGAMYATYEGFSCVDKKNTEKFLDMPQDVATELFNRIFKGYYNDKTEEELESMIEKLSIISYIQVLMIRSKYSELAYGKEKEEIDFCVNYLTEKADKLDTLEY
jgi:uncharacterized protein (TIGR02172 family)